jgi:enamine deaminase RidA (YjgF/YER057c/UK114 family)
MTSPVQRQTHSTGTPWEQSVGYSRVLRIGPHVYVAGTTASNEHGDTQSAGDPYKQAIYILKKIEAALTEVGAGLKDIVRTRIYVTDITRWGEVGQAHGEFFIGINPAATFVEVSRLINPDHMVEIEAEAYLTA